jgi:predicted metal-dependent hydrolase
MPLPDELALTSERPLAAGETSRTIALGERIVPYLLRRAARRTIGLSIDHRGLRVGAPRRASLREVESVILRHSDWVAEKLDQWRCRRRPEPLVIADGLRLPMLGQPLEIRLAQGGNRALWNCAADPVLTLCLRSPDDAGRLLEKALREKARALFAERLAHYAQRLELTAPPLALSSARTRWGSCSLKTGIRINWRLIHFPHNIIDYVVAHELAHLREMNHSPRFWAIVGTLYPNYKDARNELKRLAASCPQW